MKLTDNKEIIELKIKYKDKKIKINYLYETTNKEINKLTKFIQKIKKDIKVEEIQITTFKIEEIAKTIIT